MRKLIVNADDFGLTQGINKGIVQGFRLGIITSATALVNMPCWPHAAALASRLAGLGIGLHFNLTMGRPLTDPRYIPSLVDEEGRFAGNPEQLAQADPLDVVRELYNQYNRLLRSGIKPTHIDSHDGIHSLDNILSILLDFAARHQLPLRLVPEPGTAIIQPAPPPPKKSLRVSRTREPTGPLERLLSAVRPRRWNFAVIPAWWMPSWSCLGLRGSGNGSWRWSAHTA